jgi:hypothetical protein
MNRRIVVIVLMVVGGVVGLVMQFGSSRGAADVPNSEVPVAATTSSSTVQEPTEPITPAATLSVEERVLQSAIEELELWQAIRSEGDPAKRSELESRSQTIQTKRLQLYDYE